MKYIRTEDGIYEEAGTDALGLRCVRYKGNKIALSQEDDKIVKEADTIEELCDKFIVTATSHYTAYIAYTLEEAIEYCANNRVPKTKIRGAIWTDKGLIYVAKFKGILPNGDIDWELEWR